MKIKRILFFFIFFFPATFTFPYEAQYDPIVEKYRTNEIDPIVKKIPGDIQKSVFNDPEKNLKRLVNYLVSKAKNDDYYKVKLFHDWIIDNIDYDYEACESGKYKEINYSLTYSTTLKNRLTICSGYSKLFNKMCSLAGLVSIYIIGNSVTPGAIIESLEGHAWNAVKLNNIWYIVDVTWDDTSAPSGGYISKYLFPKPYEFIFSHFPYNPSFQFISPPVTR